jgi:hypothetical protein
VICPVGEADTLDDGDQILTLYTAESGTPDAEHLARLASDATFAA